jgi:hypothetical protein
MAKCGVLVLALLSALLLLQVALAVEEAAPVAFAEETSESLYANEASAEETEVADVPDVTGDETVFGSARMLTETKTSSKTCKSASKCHRWFKNGGCCNHWCVNLSSNNKHCGKCGKCCPKNSVCKSGKCTKVSIHKPPVHKPPVHKPPVHKPPVHKPPVHPPPVHNPQCGSKKSCGKGGKKCCHGMCSDLQNDSHNCGQCGKKCGSGSFCCKGKCKSSTNQNCGKWGIRCHFGSVCCKGECKFVHKSDRENCGACGKKCPKGVKCNMGMCGYGH